VPCCVAATAWAIHNQKWLKNSKVIHHLIIDYWSYMFFYKLMVLSATTASTTRYITAKTRRSGQTLLTEIATGPSN
jgi:hypothetical protein